MQLRKALGFHSFDEVTLESLSWKKKAETASVQKERSISLPSPPKHTEQKASKIQ